MKVCLRPTGLHSRAMVRVAQALALHAPSNVQIVEDPVEADVQILHVIGFDGLDELKAPAYAVIQYCGYVSREDKRLISLWKDAEMVWSYFPLQDVMPSGVPFLHAPLGIDPVFAKAVRREVPKVIDLITSGYSTGPVGEAIEEAAWAVDACGLSLLHIGPTDIENMTRYPKGWRARLNISDEYLRDIYLNAHRVSGLRHVEGFELPALEGFVCGARPVVFDRIDTRQWYEGIAEFVPECVGEELTERLTHLLRRAPTSPTLKERIAVRDHFDWAKIATRFWSTLLFSQKLSMPIVPPRKQRLLWVGDAGVPSGFARATHGVLDTLKDIYDVTVLGMNYNGDGRTQALYPYPLYCAAPGGDQMGVGRFLWMCDLVKPDLIVIQQDPWNFPHYLKQLKASEYVDVPVVGFVAVDGKNCRGDALEGLDLAIFWTQFGMDEAKKGGYTGPATVVPLGVDLDTYFPGDRRAARKRLGFPEELLDSFIIGNVGRNQHRKRLDLTIQYVAEWKKRYDIENVYLWFHVAPTGDTDGYDCAQLAKHYGIDLVCVEPPVWYGVEESVMRDTYNAMNLFLTTTQGEGFGLPIFEAMACGVVVIAPDWSALGELCKNAARIVPCSSTTVTTLKINSIGGVMDKEEAIVALHELYDSGDYIGIGRGMIDRARELQQKYRDQGFHLVQEPRFRWANVGKAFAQALESLSTQDQYEETWQDLGRPVSA